MSRLQVLLTAMISVLLVVLFFFLVWQPTQDEIEELEAQIEQELTRQTQLNTQLERLRQVRAEAPESEARLARGEAIIPRDSSLPAALRQLQSAADDAGVILSAVNTSRPQPVDEELSLATISLNTQVSGSYFQMVDFLRRVEDPTLTSRGILWQALNVGIGEYPVLDFTLAGQMFALTPETQQADEPEPDEETDEVDPDGLEPDTEDEAS